MGIVIIGGNECMVCQYQDICKRHGYKAKVFAKQHGVLNKKIGLPDMIILFTSTVSHSMVNSALNEAKKYNIPVCRCRSSSAAALNALLAEETSKRKACYV
ncbi:MAG: DUF2325 domain-containing protein [Clostridia bacterium]|nr:DUF2325 domain-containing protein [Clostridia bacterium]